MTFDQIIVLLEYVSFVKEQHRSISAIQLLNLFEHHLSVCRSWIKCPKIPILSKQVRTVRYIFEIIGHFLVGSL